MRKVIETYDSRFWFLCLSSFFYFFSFNLILPQLPEFLTSLGGGKYIGLIISLFAASALATRPFSGKLIEHIGRKPLITIGVLISTVVCFAYPFAGTAMGFLFLRFVHGFSAGCAPTGTTAYVADVVPIGKRGEAMGILGMANNLGMSIGPAFGGEVAIKFGNIPMFFTAAFFSCITLIALIKLPESHHLTQRFRWSFLRIRKVDIFEPRVTIQGIIMFLTVASFGTVLTLIPDYCDHLLIKRRGLFFTVLTGTSLLIRFAGGRWSDIYGRAYVMQIGTLLLIVANALLMYAHNSLIFYAAAAVFGLAVGLNSPTIFAWVIDLGNPKALGRAISTLFICLELGIIVGSVFPAWIYSNDYGRLPAAFSFPFVLSIVALVFVVREQRINKQLA
jgi:MFS family permease